MPSNAQHASLVERYADLLEATPGDQALLDVVAELDALCAAAEPASIPPLSSLIADAEPTFTLDDPALAAMEGDAKDPVPLALVALPTSDVPPGRRHSSAAQSAHWRRVARVGRRLVAAGLVAALVLAFSALLAQRTHPPRPGDDTLPTPTAVVSPTPNAITPAPDPTATSLPALPIPIAPTATPSSPISVALLPESGSDIAVDQNVACTSGSAHFVFHVLVYLPASTTSINFAWQHYDGATPLPDQNQPSDGQYSQAPDQRSPLTTSTTGPPPVDWNMWDTWMLPPNDFTGSQARWGDQFLITAVNGAPLATPIKSNVLYYATGC
jgi:hypothetical protein